MGLRYNRKNFGTIKNQQKKSGYTILRYSHKSLPDLLIFCSEVDS